MSKSNDIITAIPCRAGTQKHKEIMTHIMTAITGGKVYFNKCWSRSKGYANLIRTPHAFDAYLTLKNAGVKIITGNDAPRNGATGDFFTAKLHGNIVNALKKYIDNLSETC